MGHNFHLMLSLCSKEVTFPYIPFPKIKTVFLMNFRTLSEGSHVVNWSLKYGGVVSWFTFF